jgi:hypothetical protein
VCMRERECVCVLLLFVVMFYFLRCVSVHLPYNKHIAHHGLRQRRVWRRKHPEKKNSAKSNNTGK